ncbi:DUF4158 domain-containing protein [Couchioplanes caeruleus]|uniref:DUF4158 domain-containing protein n=1 Tax=Couchioplanes caeruleus subsp. caeruleus TaxID=56427 RepID=A0A1K0FRK9_9ACTN|nr:hypothetical protein [Couchioplanes caeruleus]OJF15477.1 hypothetical protein BG844_04385 [Couchioplanes caeruleus subsp. caeruleus]
MTSIERTAYPRFKRFLSARELHVFYTPQPEEIGWASGQVRSDGQQVGPVIGAGQEVRAGAPHRREDHRRNLTPPPQPSRTPTLTLTIHISDILCRSTNRS